MYQFCFDWSLALSWLGLSVCLSQSQTSFCRAKESPLNHWIPNWTSKSCFVRLSEPDLWRETLLSLVVGIFDWSSRKWLGEGVVLGERIGWLTASSLLDCILSIWQPNQKYNCRQKRKIPLSINVCVKLPDSMMYREERGSLLVLAFSDYIKYWRGWVIPQGGLVSLLPGLPGPSSVQH